MSFYGLTRVVSLNDSVYAPSRYRGDILHFRRDSAGNLAFAGCIGNTPGCTPRDSRGWEMWPRSPSVRMGEMSI